LAAATGGAALGVFGTAAGAGGFVGGAVAAGVAYTSSTVVTSMGNNIAFGDPMPTAGQFATGLGFSMLTGGALNGIVSATNGGSFWTGPKVPQPTVTAPTQPTAQTPNTNNTQAQQPQTPAEKMQQVREMGRVAEEAVGIDPNITKTPISSATETAQYRLPDRLSSVYLDEVKNVSHLEYTSQIKDFVQYSQTKGLQMRLWIRPENTIFGPGTTFSPAMNNAIYQYGIDVQRIPFGITFFRITFSVK